MKKLLLSETACTILAISVFILFFTLLDGWEMSGQERYDVAASAAFAAFAAAAVVAVVVAVVAVAAVAASAVAAVVASAAVVAVATSATVATSAAAVAVVAVVAVAIIVATGAISVGGAEKIGVSKKTLWLSLSAEVVIIAGSLFVITFVL